MASKIDVMDSDSDFGANMKNEKIINAEVQSNHHRLVVLKTLTPLHIGGEQGDGLIDKPILRERHTGWPLIPGTAVKGVLADSYDASASQRADSAQKKAAFGRASENSEDQSGALLFTDLRILCLPVRSQSGTFAWVSSKAALNRFEDELREFAGYDNNNLIKLATPNQISVATESSLRVGEGNVVVLEDLLLQESAGQGDTTKTLATQLASQLHLDADWRANFVERFALVTDNVFNHFCATALELRPRVKIDNKTGVVEKGKFWYEELVPEQAIFVGHVFCEKVFSVTKNEGKKFSGSGIDPNSLLEQFCTKTKRLQFGGTGSVGRGQCQVRFVTNAAD